MLISEKKRKVLYQQHSFHLKMVEKEGYILLNLKRKKEIHMKKVNRKIETIN